MEARTGSAGAVEAPNTGSSSADPAGSTAAQAEAGAGVKRESVPAEGQGKKLKTDVAAEDAATSSDAVSAATMKELVTTLVTMHKKVAELSRLESERSSAAAAAFEEEVDYGLALLLEEQRRLAAQVAELTSRVNSAAPAPPDLTEEQLVEEAWAALRATDPVAAEGKLRALRPSAVAAMKDVAGVTPLHVAARERWLGLTGFLLEVAPGMACERGGRAQCPVVRHLLPLRLSQVPVAAAAAVQSPASGQPVHARKSRISAGQQTRNWSIVAAIPLRQFAAGSRLRCGFCHSHAAPECALLQLQAAPEAAGAAVLELPTVVDRDARTSSFCSDHDVSVRLAQSSSAWCVSVLRCGHPGKNLNQFVVEAEECFSQEDLDKKRQQMLVEEAALRAARAAQGHQRSAQRKASRNKNKATQRREKAAKAPDSQGQGGGGRRPGRS